MTAPDLFTDFPIGARVVIRGLAENHGVIAAHYQAVASDAAAEGSSRLVGIRWGESSRLAFWDNNGVYNSRRPLEVEVGA